MNLQITKYDFIRLCNDLLVSSPPPRRVLYLGGDCLESLYNTVGLKEFKSFLSNYAELYTNDKGILFLESIRINQVR
jgi:hypothetical protein